MILAGFSSAILLLFSFNSMLLDSANDSMKIIQLNAESQQCAFIADIVYASSVQKIEKKISCTVLNGKATSADENFSGKADLLNSKTKTIFRSGKTIILVEENEHYK
jgi:hypothetical protein